MNILGYKEMMKEARAWESEPRNIPISNQLIIELDTKIQQLQQQLADAQRERDEAKDYASGLVAAMDSILFSPFDIEGYQTAKEAANWFQSVAAESLEGNKEALEELKRREQVKGIRAAVCALKMPRYQQSPYVILDGDLEDYANKIQSGEVTIK